MTSDGTLNLDSPLHFPYLWNKMGALFVAIPIPKKGMNLALFDFLASSAVSAFSFSSSLLAAETEEPNST